MSDSYGKRKASIINLSLFANLSETFSSSSNKTPRKFGGDGVVGLGIVAAMNHENKNVSKTHDSTTVTTKISSISQPIPIVSVKPLVAKLRKPSLEIDEMKLSEGYTCVISRVGRGNNSLVKKREYFGDDDEQGDNNGDLQGGGGGGGALFFTSYSEPDPVIQASDDFLSTCCLCKKKLHGLDIFMYRGYKAFCSEDCRSKQIRNDDRKRKRDAMKKSFDYSVSPCSASRFVTASVAAA